MRYSGFNTPSVQMIQKVYRKLGPLGHKMAWWLEQGRYDLILKTPMPDPSSQDFPLSYAAWNLLRKSSIPDVGLDRARAALSGWYKCEIECLRTNYSHGVRPDMICSTEKPVAEAVLFTAIRKIADCLGTFDIEELFSSAEFSGGASTQRVRKHSAIQNKYVDNPYISPDAYRYWLGLHSLTHLDLGEPIISMYSRFTTVPKNAKTDRPIIIEPQGNMFFQKGLGSMIRQRLKRKGINLNDQTRNQNLAAAGVAHRLATIDLSSASDLISYQTVVLLLSGAPAWRDALCDLRVGTTRVEGEFHNLQKFSGMGNGFTFELESLIFWALAEASAEVESLQGGCSCEKVISIYGDDIIVNSHHVDTLLVALSYCGFQVNKEKSYWSGPFRESCGKHYHNGTDISPVTFTDQDLTKVEDLYWFYNSIRDLFDRLCIPYKGVLAPVEAKLRAMKAWNYVPPRFGNTSGIQAPFDIACPRSKRKPKSRKTPWFMGFEVTYLAPTTRRKKVSSLGAYWFKLRANGDNAAIAKSVRGFLLNASDVLDILSPIDLTVVDQATGRSRFVKTEVSVWD